MTSRTRTRRDLIIAVWEELDCESVGSSELEEIQRALTEEFGSGGVLSPAAIARVVADEGAVLRHPEVFECDFNWREENLRKAQSGKDLDFSDLSSAFASLVKLEERRLQQPANESASLGEIVSAARDEALLQARSKVIDKELRERQKEIANWLTVWLQSPALFSDWLDLRRRSPEFLKKFVR